ncbi:MAG: type transport system ATP-binding protein [Acidobacteriota bacterium]|jgi:ABC-2 type transport system ATP-binding protein|nr:type transport system ATP-binding protein [Acidobacteriota bacterium]
MSGLPEPDPGAFAVTTHGLSMRYGSETALDGVDLRVPEGAVYVLIGANGAGKSTAMKVLLNLERPDAGRAEVFGLDTAAHGAQVRAQVGYMPESREHDYNWMTAGRLIQHVATHYPAWDHQYAAQLIEIFGVRLERKVGTLSKGESRRLQFVLALAHRPPLLLLDEPTDGLDPMVRNRTLAHLAEHLADTPTTVVIATHHIAEVESLADHVGVLREGRLVAQMTRDELRRTVLRYRVEVAEGWEAPPELRMASLRRSRGGREVQWTLIGEEREVTARLAAAGATVRDVTPLALEEAALAFLAEEGRP